MHSESSQPSPVLPRAPAPFQAQFSDGRTAAARAVTVTFEATGLRIRDGHSDQDSQGAGLLWPYAQLSSGGLLTDQSRDIVVSMGERSPQSLYITDRAALGDLMARASQLTERSLRRAGLRSAAPVGIAAAALVGVVTLLDLSPSKAIARMIPDQGRTRIGESVLQTLPVQRTCEATDGRAALDALVYRLRPDLKDKPHKVRVLDWNLVNAFAVPGGSVVLTRAIINQAASADELAGVLAHEMGHGMELHPESGLVRGIGFWAVLQMMFTGSPGAAGNLGGMLVQLAYSRGYEREADTIALDLLRKAEIAHKPFAGFFRRMEQRRGGRVEDKGRSRAADIFQTHPNSPERIARIENQTPYASRPALTEIQWQALRRICGGAPTGPGAPVDTSNSDIRPKTTAPGTGMDGADARIKSNPNAAAGYAERAQVHMRERRYADAVKDYTAAIEREAGSAFYRYERGRAYQNASNFAAARADYDEAIKLNPRYSNAFAARGATHRLENRQRQARADLDEAIRINPRNEYALYQRGLINAAETRWSESEADFARVLASQRSYALAHVRRAEALEQLKRRDEAIAGYRDALASSPSSPDATIAFDVARDRLKALGAP